MLQLQLGMKGELIIPKKIRDQLGIIRGRPVFIEIKEKSVEIRPATDIDIAKKWEERAKKYGANVSKWVYGDKLYEEIF